MPPADNILRICIVGTSHVGAWRSGWRLVEDRLPRIEARFFAAPATTFDKLTIDNRRRLVLPDDAPERDLSVDDLMEINGRTDFDLSGFDIVVMAGASTWHRRLPELLDDHDVSGLCWTGQKPPLSGPVFQLVLDAMIADGMPAPGWRHWSPRRLIVAERPRAREAAVKSRFEAFAAVCRFSDLMDLAASRTRIAYEAEGFEYLPQPPSTIAPGGLTIDRLSRGSERLRGGVLHPARDLYHMNAQYGAECWRALAERLGV